MQSGAITLRLAERGDSNAIATMSRDLIEAGLGWAYRPERIRRMIGNRESNTLLACDQSDPVGFAVMRSCASTSRVGPLFADSPGIAAALVAALARQTGATGIAIDIPDINKPAVALAEAAGLKPSFETARMYTADPPAMERAGLFGVTSLELG